MDRLRSLHLEARSSFNIYEKLQEFRAPNVVGGNDLAHLHAQALGTYRGFFNIVEHALDTEVHIATAKLYDSHKDALHIEKLVNYATHNQKILTKPQVDDLDKSEATSNEIAKAYEGMDKTVLKQIKQGLDDMSDAIERLKTVRDKKVAHIDWNETEEIKYLTYQEFHDLIMLSERILNTVSVKIYGDSALFDPYQEEVSIHTESLLELVAKASGITTENNTID